MISDATAVCVCFQGREPGRGGEDCLAKTPRRRSRLGCPAPSEPQPASRAGGRRMRRVQHLRLPRPGLVGRPGSAGLVPNAARVGPLRGLPGRRGALARAALPHRGLEPAAPAGPRGSPREQYRGPLRGRTPRPAPPRRPAPRALAEGVEPQAARDSPARESERGGR